MSEINIQKTNEQKKEDSVNAIVNSINYTFWLMLYTAFALGVCALFNAPARLLGIFKLQILMVVGLTVIGFIYGWCKTVHPDRRNAISLINVIDFCYERWLIFVWFVTTFLLIHLCMNASIK